MIRQIFCVCCFGSVGKCFVSVDLFYIAKIMKDVREGVLSS